MRRTIFPLVAVALLLAPAAHAEPPRRVIAVGGAVTEIVYALGAEGALVGVDTSSTFPPAATKLPQVGYQRTLGAEGVLSLQPDLVLATADAGPPAALAQLRAAGTRLETVPSGHSVEGTQARVRAVAAALNCPERGEPLSAALGSVAAGVRARVERRPAGERPRVLFLLSRGGGAFQASGTGTAADAMIALCGGTNALPDYAGYRPLTSEGAVAAAPDVILTTARAVAEAGGVDAILARPELAATPAGRARRLVAMDDLRLLGFGPRLGEAMTELAAALETPGR